jgi:hypothetical protein
MLVFGFYVLGLWAAVFHFCNGIWTFCISWGITVGAKAQRKMGFACTGLAALLLVWGHVSLAAFATDERPGGAPETAMVAPDARVGAVSAADSAGH